MKKLFFFATLIAATAFGLTSCSDSNGGDSPSGGDGEGQAYIAIRLNNVGTVPGMGSKPFLRVGKESTVTGYENGTDEEGNVFTARFYFFNSDGTPYALANNNGLNYLENTSISTTEVTGEKDGDNETVERKTTAVLVIDGERNALPARVAVVANYDQLAGDVLGNVSLSETELSALTRITTKYAGANDNLFVMSNSVYLDESGLTHGAGGPLVSTPIDASSFKTTAQDATDHPVSIYVERVAARVDVSEPTATEDIASKDSGWVKVSTLTGDANATGWAYKLNVKNKNNKLEYVNADPVTTTETNADGDDVTTITYQQSIVKTDKQQLYVVVKGWGLADENNNGAIIKTLAKSYTNLGEVESNPLSVAAYHRSFWETKSDYATTRYTFNNYIGESDLAAGKTGTAFGKALGGKAYTFPNTPTTTYSWSATNLRTEAADDDDYYAPTKVVVAAQLMYLNTTTNKLEPAEISTYRNRHYLSADDVIKVIANDVAHSTTNNIYKLTGGTAGTASAVYETIGTSDFTLETGDAGTKQSYLLTPTLKTGVTYYKKSIGNNNVATFTAYPTTGDKTAQKALEAVAGTDITIYTTGDTYYYTTLQHLWMPTVAKEDYASKPDNIGAWGVVRNHLYRVNLTGLTGWGTPVYKPNDEIIPITPTDENVYLGAQINVLQWRVVDQEANIDATPIITN